MMKNILKRQMPANKNMQPNPRVSVKYGRNFVVINASDHISAIQNDIPNSFNLSGIISEMIKNGSGKMAHDAIKMATENATNGIQLNVSKL